MKNIFRTIGGKLVLLLVCLLSAITCLFSLLGAIVMLDYDFYTRSLDEIYRQAIYSEVGSAGEDLVYSAIYGWHSSPSGNLQYKLVKTDEGTILTSESAETINQWHYAVGFQYNTQYEQLNWNYFDRDNYTGNESFRTLFREAWGYDYDVYVQEDTLAITYEEAYSTNGVEEYAADTVAEAEEEIQESVAGSVSSSKGSSESASPSTGSVSSASEAASSETASAEEVTEETFNTQAIRPTYMFFANIDTTFPVHDSFYITYRLLSTAYSLRYYIILIAGLTFLLSIFSFVGLMSVAGRHYGSEELYYGPFHKFPADILVLLWSILAISTAALILDYYSSDWVTSALMALAGLVFGGLFLLMSMNIAIKVKDHTLMKSTLIYRIFHFFAGFFSGMKIVPKLTLVALGIILIELFIVLVSGHAVIAFCFLMVVDFLLVLPLVIRLGVDLKKIQQTSEALAAGDLSRKLDTSRLLPFMRQQGATLNALGDGMTIAVDSQLRSERMKTELITNVSHDLKTPLTSIINYADLISKETTDNEKITEYSEVLVRQSTKLKRLIEDLVEASKAATGNLDVELAPCDASVFLTQAAGEFEDRLASSNLTMVTSLPEEEVRILADGRRMWRIFDNLMNNVCKYALPGTRVYLSLEKYNTNAVIILKNTSREPLNMSEEALMERFTRGDSSRNTEGNGLGLSIAKSMAELQNGHLHVSIDGDLFKATLLFPLINQ